jgi:hypothetical protein
MSKPAGVSIQTARAILRLLDLLLADSAVDDDTRAQASWLRARLGEVDPSVKPAVPDFLEARIAVACPAEGKRRAAAA